MPRPPRAPDPPLPGTPQAHRFAPSTAAGTGGGMRREPVIRPAIAADRPAIERLVLTVVREVYGHLFKGEVPGPEGNWARALVAEKRGRIVGVVVAADDWIEDLWVARDHRGRGLGSRLLAAGERKVAAQGHAVAHLRVAADNERARRFYVARGWAETDAYPHERWGFMMLDLIKPLAPAGAAGAP
jgi:ribosomal protein S18 acetylase RimI-like enzyme